MKALVIDTAEAPARAPGHQIVARPTNRQNVVRLGEQIVFTRRDLAELSSTSRLSNPMDRR